MKRALLILVILLLSSALSVGGDRFCFARAFRCNATCTAVAPPGGAVHCYSNDTEVVCQHKDPGSGIWIIDDIQRCGGGGGACDPSIPNCDPWAY